MVVIGVVVGEYDSSTYCLAHQTIEGIGLILCLVAIDEPRRGKGGLRAQLSVGSRISIQGARRFEDPWEVIKDL